MKRKNIVLWMLVTSLALLTVLLSAACRGSPTSTESPTMLTATHPMLTDTTALPPPAKGKELGPKTPVTAPTQSPATGNPETDRMLATAKANLGAQLSVAEEEISILSFEAVEWPDASLGCPQPDMIYAQVITPGYRVILEAGGEEYEVHTDGGQAAVVCEKETSAMETTPEAGTIDAGLGSLIELAREDLAQRLSVPDGEIEILEATVVVWPDASLGCPQPGMTYARVLQDGLLIRLGAGGQMYVYHSSSGGEPFLCEDSAQMIPRATPKYNELLPPPGSETD